MGIGEDVFLLLQRKLFINISKLYREISTPTESKKQANNIEQRLDIMKILKLKYNYTVNSSPIRFQVFPRFSATAFQKHLKLMIEDVARLLYLTWVVNPKTRSAFAANSSKQMEKQLCIAMISLVARLHAIRPARVLW